MINPSGDCHNESPYDAVVLLPDIQKGQIAAALTKLATIQQLKPANGSGYLSAKGAIPVSPGTSE
jgi:hypothetical protein